MTLQVAARQYGFLKSWVRRCACLLCRNGNRLEAVLPATDLRHEILQQVATILAGDCEAWRHGSLC